MDAWGSALLVGVFGVALVVWYGAVRATVMPFHDGSHHVAIVANLVARLKLLGPAYLPAYAQLDTPGFLSYFVFSIPSLLIGPGRLAFGVVWIACLAAIMLSFWRVFHVETRHLARLFALSLFLFLGLFQAEAGGAWDTRIDLLSATFCALSLLSLLTERYFEAALLAICAAFAKGAALPLLVPLLVLGFVTGSVRLPRRQHTLWLTIAKAGVVLVLLAVFLVRVGPEAVSYNLMATGEAVPGNRVQVFVRNIVAYLIREPAFYGQALLRDSRAWSIIALVPLVLLTAVWRGWQTASIRLGCWSMLSLAYTYALMTISPLHSSVLAIWFLPALTLCVVFVARVLTLHGSPSLTATLAIVLGAASVAMLRLSPAPVLNSDYAGGLHDAFEQAREMAAFLDAPANAVSGNTVLLVNFLASDGPITNNYDAYRVLIQEQLHRPLVLDGWELGTRGPDWHTELQAQASYANVLFLIEQNPPGLTDDNNPQRNGPSVAGFVDSLRRSQPECLVEVAAPIVLPHVGRQEAFELANDPACRKAVFEQ